MTCVLEIDLSAIRENYQYLARDTSKRIAGVVKADAYGLGAARVVSELVNLGCKEFFVANVEEGKALRSRFDEIILYVLEGVLESTYDDLLRHKLRPVLNTLAQCELWSKQSAPCAIHIDSGMERLGLNEDEMNQVLGDPNQLNPQLLMSHLARADEPDHRFNQLQIERFNLIRQRVSDRFPEVETSLTNSAGLAHRGYVDDLGRPGIALYGGNPFSDRSNPMSPVVRLMAQVLQVRRVEQGVPVGYGGTFVTDQASVLAIIGAGYADGISRALSNKGRAFVSGSYCPIVGRVSMDTIHVDVTGVEVKEGDWVELIGSNMSLDEVALQSGTISYEVLTNLGRRCSRVYLGSAT